jgi:hypothetical protein
MNIHFLPNATSKAWTVAFLALFVAGTPACSNEPTGQDDESLANEGSTEGTAEDEARGQASLGCGQTVRVQERRRAKVELVLRLNLGKSKIGRVRALAIGARTGDTSELWYDFGHLPSGSQYTPADVSKGDAFSSPFQLAKFLFPAVCDADERGCLLKKGQSIGVLNQTRSAGSNVINTIFLAYDGRPGGVDYALVHLECLDKAPPEE